MIKHFVVVISLLLGAAAAYGQKPATVTLRGQVVCSGCWAETPDRKKVRYGTTADIECAIDCSKSGLPQGLAVENAAGFTLYLMEPGEYRLTEKDFLNLVPRFVEVEGVTRDEREKHFIRVNALKTIDEKQAFVARESSSAVELNLKDPHGVEQSLAAYRGRVVVVNFWATWCGPCRREMPDLKAINKAYAARGVEMIGASTDEAADLPAVVRFVRNFKLNYLIWVGATEEDMARFGVQQLLPATVVIDREGKIVWRRLGTIKPAILRRELDKALARQPADALKVAKK